MPFFLWLPSRSSEIECETLDSAVREAERYYVSLAGAVADVGDDGVTRYYTPADWQGICAGRSDGAYPLAAIAERVGLAALGEADLRALLAEVDAACRAGADGWTPPAGWEPGDPDGCWDHPGAAGARELSAELGVVWDFTTWADLARSIRLALDQRGAAA